MKKLFLVFFAFSTVLFAQGQQNSLTPKSRKLKYADQSFYTIKNNIFRVLLSAPLIDANTYEPNIIISGNYEHTLNKNISLSTIIGIGSAKNNSFGYAGSTQLTSYHVASDIEIRYYYALKKRLKNYRPTMNYSGGYFSLDQNILTNAIFVISDSSNAYKYAINGHGGLYVNVGYQRQYGSLFFNAYGGALLLNESNKTLSNVINSLHAGITIGFVFK